MDGIFSVALSWILFWSKYWSFKIYMEINMNLLSTATHNQFVEKKYIPVTITTKQKWQSPHIVIPTKIRLFFSIGKCLLKLFSLVLWNSPHFVAYYLIPYVDKWLIFYALRVSVILFSDLGQFPCFHPPSICNFRQETGTVEKKLS